MAVARATLPPGPAGRPLHSTTWRSQLFEFIKRAVLGAAVGSISGVVVGGVLGRLAMFVLRLTSPDSLSGALTDDEFEIGRFTLSGSLNLIVASAFFGAIIGLFVVLSRAFMPWSWVKWAWGVAGGVVVGSMIISDDGLDFTLLEPLWLAVAMFVALPAVGALLMAFLVERFEPWWWQRRTPTIIVGLTALPLLAFFPAAIAVCAIGLIWAFASRYEAIRRIPDLPVMQRTATAGFALIVVVFGWLLVIDLRAVLG